MLSIKKPVATKGTTVIIRISSVIILSVIASTAWAQETELKELRAQARSAPRDAEVQAKLGHALLEAGRWKEAERQLQAAARLKRNSPEADYEVIEVKLARGDHKASRAACRALSQKHPDSPLGDVCMARAFLVWRRASLALPYLEKVLQKDSSNLEALLALGEAGRMSGQKGKSEQAYQRAMQIAPDDARIYLGLGRLYSVFQAPDRAREALRTALAKNPGSPDIQLELARLLKGEERLKLLQSAAAGRPGWDDAGVLLAESLLLAGRTEEAEKLAAGVLERAAGRADASSVLGRARLALKNFQGAEEALKRALELVPNDYEAALALAAVFGETDRPDEALEKYRETADIDPSDIRALIDAARLAMKLDRKAVAAGFLERAVSRKPSDAVVLALLGEVTAARGDRVKARGYYERALKGSGEIDREKVKAALQQLR
jgi:tetratricopeptide (TPR) repeat protein